MGLKREVLLAGFTSFYFLDENVGYLWN